MRIIYVSTSISDASESIILFADGYTTQSSPDKYKLSGKEVLICELLKNRTSLRKIAKLSHVDRNILARFISLKGLVKY